MAAIFEPDVISLCCGPQRRYFSTYYLPSKFRCHSFNILGGGVRISPPPPVPEDPKKPGLNRVNSWFKRRTRHVYCQTPYYLFGPQQYSEPAVKTTFAFSLMTIKAISREDNLKRIYQLNFRISGYNFK